MIDINTPISPFPLRFQGKISLTRGIRICSKDLKKDASRADIVKAINELKEVTKETNKMLGGFIGNQATSTEEEVVKAVCSYLGVEFEEAHMNRKFFDHDERLIAEVDGVVPFDGGLAVVEVKSRIQESSLAQLARNVRLVEERRNKKAWGFIGRPLFDRNVKSNAVKQGFKVVELCEKRYVIAVDNSKN
ncbi:hypothetical protein MP638_006656 [Amoeboaphelidium occidentale]|nr:hypothetical protein MP638_006656 [Amoeboaphelidium occidentale]